ncbi:MAG: protein kinase [Actinobacteria bacterium]|nr:protein kinase [Actinomycetota bacterium]
MRADPRVGSELAGHRLEAVIARGGMAVVYLAEHLRLGRKVALKILDPELVDDEAFRVRFIRESRIAAGLDHPNIVTVYDAGETEGVLYISMRYVEGIDLERLLRQETRLEPTRSVLLVSQCASALDAAHAEGLVHRDVKPANILLASGPAPTAEHVYLTDFGITKRVRSDAGITRTGQFVGTVDYVAPEQIQGQDVDGRADVYSLGCVLYRCLTGEVPFPRDTEVATIYAHLQDAPPAPSERFGELPVAIDQVLSRALAKSREHRYPTCDELVEATARAIGPPARTSAQADGNRIEAPTTPKSQVGRGRPTRRRRSALVVTGLASLTAVAVAAGLLLRPAEPVSPPDGTGPVETQSALELLSRLVWRQVPDTEGVFRGRRDQNITRAVTTDGVIVAVGRDDSGPDGDAAVWRSSGGTRWHRVQDRSLGGAGEQQMAGATLFDQDVVAVGWERFGGDADAAVWISITRGRTWERVEDVVSGLDEAGDQAMRRVISTGTGLVAVGSETTPEGLDAAVWGSEDGHHWSRMPSRFFAGSGDQEAFGATTLESRLVVVGYQTTESGDQDAAVWVESAGAWLPVDDPSSLAGGGDQRMTAVMAAGPGVVAVGFDTSGGDHDAAVWTSRDGLNWERVPADEAIFGGPGNQQMFALAQVGLVLVVGGVSDNPGGDADGAIWLSLDGIEWTRIRSSTIPASALGGLGKQQIKTLVVFGDRLVAAGSEARARDDGAAVWIARVPPPAASP